MGKLHDHDKIILEHEHSWLTVTFFVELETKFDFLSCILFLTIFKFAAVAFFPHNKKKNMTDFDRSGQYNIYFKKWRKLLLTGEGCFLSFLVLMYVRIK